MAALSYDEMLAGFKRAGHDVSHMKRPATVPSEAERTSCSALTIDGLADVLDETINRRLDPLAVRVRELEVQIRGLQARAPVLPSKPRVLALPLRDGKPVVRLLRSAAT
jgi:hypothetical protein